MPINLTSTDTINLTDPIAGNANAGNGGDGTNDGDINYTPVANVSNTQTVTGSAPTVFNGDIVDQDAGWAAGTTDGGNLTQTPTATDSALANTGTTGGGGGSADSNGDQSNTSGGNVAAVAADTNATQNTTLVADQSATILAGVGGAGGSDNTALGGSNSAALVHSNPIEETTTVSNILDTIENATISDLGF